MRDSNLEAVALLEPLYSERGLHLPRLGLWLDPHRAVTGPERVFVSHAHSDHTAPHREVILTGPTSKLMHARVGGQRVEHLLPYGEAHTFEGAGSPFRITLLPAGHVLGSAMAWIESEGASLLYTGDFKLRVGLAAEPCEPRQADVLVMETTFGRPEYRFPPTDQVGAGIVRFCRETIAEGQTAVLLGYSLGKSQELLYRLADAGLPIMLHHQVLKLTAVYETCGLVFPPYERLDPDHAAGKVLVCPPQAARGPWLRKLGPCRVAFLSGWAVDISSRFRSGADAAFPLSDHADFDDLLRLVELVQPRRVLTLHGFAADFARELRTRGYDARALSEIEQLELRLAMNPPSPRPAPVGPERAPSRTVAPVRAARHVPSCPDAPVSSVEAFEQFALTSAQIAAEPGEHAKVECLARYLRSVPPDWLSPVVIWFCGQPFAGVENRRLPVGWAALRVALCTVTGVSEEVVRQAYLRHSDTGETAAALWPSPDSPGGRLSLAAVAQGFDALEKARGSTGKVPLLAQILGQCSAIEAKYLAKIITSGLRIGLKAGLVEEAIALAFQTNVASVRRAHLLGGHLGQVAALARRGEVDRAGLVPFRPVQPMLASPEPTAVAVWTRKHPEPGPGEPVWVEDQYDGVRCQLHKVGDRVALFSHDAREITAAFPELADDACALAADLILDGKVLAMRGQDVLPFAELQKRLGRQVGDLRLGGEVPVTYVAFDLLWRDGTTWLDAPLTSRRQQLERLGRLPPTFRLAQVTWAGSILDP